MSTEDMSSLVDFFIVGAPKCGTTAWVNYLSTHPAIRFSRLKEPHYFSEDFPRFRWARTLDEYHGLFDAADEDGLLYAEASIMYLYSQVAAKKIYEYNSRAKILIFIRPYVDFLSSYHRQVFNILEEDEPDFKTAWDKQSLREEGRCIPKDCREPLFLQYKKVAEFGTQIDRYYGIFPSDQIKIICFEKWTVQPRETYLDILSFLDLHDDGRQSFEMVNAAKWQKSRFLAKLIRRPPQFLLSLSRQLKRVLNIERLGLAKKVRGMNEVETKVESVPIDLKAEINREMNEDLSRMVKYVDPASLGC